MKRTFLFSCSFLLLHLLTAQTPALKLAKVGFGFGGDVEMPYQLGHTYLLETTTGSDFRVDTEKFGEGEIQGMECDNGSSSLTVALAPAGSSNMEWRISLYALDNRVDQVDYLSADKAEFLTFKAISREIGLETVYLRKDRLAKWISVYGGGGLNSGISYDGKVEVTEGLLLPAGSDPVEGNGTDETFDGYRILQETTYTYDQRDGFSQRIFLQAGFGLHFLKKMEFGVNFRRGFGYRAMEDGPFTFTSLKSSVAMGFTYSIF